MHRCNAEISEVRKKTAAGIVSLGLRQIGAQGIGLVANVFLARILEPRVFGVYGITLSVVSFLALFGDLGLGAALIQRPEEPSEQEISGVFTLQLVLFGAMVVGVILGAPLIVSFYGLEPSTAWFARFIGLSLIFSALRSTPAVLLERELAFSKLAVIDIGNALVFQGVTVIGAWLGWGIWSFAAGTLARSMVDTAQVYLVSKYRPTIRLQWDSEMKNILRFGAGTLGLQLAGFAKNNISSLLVGLVLGATQVGYLNWAVTYAAIPLLLTRMFQRVFFPAFARSQDDDKTLARMLETAISLTVLIGMPVILVLGIFARDVVPIVYTGKWLVALPAAYLLLINGAIGLVVEPLFAFLRGIGRIAIALRIFALWTIATWIAAVALVHVRETTGVALAYALGSLISVSVLIWRAHRIVSFDLWSALRAPIIAGLFAALAGWLSDQWVFSDRLGLYSPLAAISVLLSSYALIVFSMDRERISVYTRVLKSTQLWDELLPDSLLAVRERVKKIRHLA